MGITRLQKRRRCYLLEIPPELRLYIYEYLLETPGYKCTHESLDDLTVRPTGALVINRCTVPLYTDEVWIHNVFRMADLLPELTSMLRTCKRIKAEAEPLWQVDIESKTYNLTVEPPGRNRSPPPVGRLLSSYWLYEACPIIKHIRDLRLHFNHFNLAGVTDRSALHSLGQIFDNIDYGSKLKTLRIEADIERSNWPSEGVVELLKMLDRLKCEYTITPDRSALEALART